jgi:1-deoxy-D-xylulose 5-phosphate reductoisomerase
MSTLKKGDTESPKSIKTFYHRISNCNENGGSIANATLPICRFISNRFSVFAFFGGQKMDMRKETIKRLTAEAITSETRQSLKERVTNKNQSSSRKTLRDLGIRVVC